MHLLTNTDNCRVQYFSNPTEMVHLVRAHHEPKGTWLGYLYDSAWTGRRFDSWAHLERDFHRPWMDGLKVVSDMLSYLEEHELPDPVDIHRRPTWRDDEGELDCQRLLNGEQNVYRRAHRTRIQAAQTITIVCQLGDPSATTAKDMMWRGAAVVAAVDLLEKQGYSCEVVMFDHGRGAYYGYKDQSLIICKLKEAGNPLDINTLTNCISAWFVRCVSYAALHLAGPAKKHCGWPVYNYDGFEEFLGIDETTQVYRMDSVHTEADAVASIRRLLLKLEVDNDRR